MKRFKLKQIQNPYIRNLLFAVDDIPTNPLVHIFLYTTFVVGLSFVFFPVATGASATVLYQITISQVGGIGTSIWGVVAMLATAVNTVAYIYRRKWLGHLSSYIGWGTWFFATWIYFSAGFSIGFLVLALPNLMFWTWQFFAVSKYHMHFHSGLYPRPKHGKLVASPFE